jgi:hypothetical protein
MKVRSSLPPKRPSSTTATPKIEAEEQPQPVWHLNLKLAVLYTQSYFFDQIPNLLHAAIKRDSWSEIEEKKTLNLFRQTFITFFITAHNWSVLWSIRICYNPSPLCLSTSTLFFHRCIGLPSYQFCPIFTPHLSAAISSVSHSNA